MLDRMSERPRKHYPLSLRLAENASSDQLADLRSVGIHRPIARHECDVLTDFRVRLANANAGVEIPCFRERLGKCLNFVFELRARWMARIGRIRDLAHQRAPV